MTVEMYLDQEAKVINVLQRFLQLTITKPLKTIKGHGIPTNSREAWGWPPVNLGDSGVNIVDMDCKGMIL